MGKASATGAFPEKKTRSKPQQKNLKKEAGPVKAKRETHKGEANREEMEDRQKGVLSFGLGCDKGGIPRSLLQGKKKG